MCEEKERGTGQRCANTHLNTDKLKHTLITHTKREKKSRRLNYVSFFSFGFASKITSLPKRSI